MYYLQGLATAYTLRRAGHDVVVLEKGYAQSTVRFCLQNPFCFYTPELSEFLYGWSPVSIHVIYNFYSFTRVCTRSPPNMTRLLYKWGLGPTLDEMGTKSNRIVYVNGGAIVRVHNSSDNHTR